MLINDEWRRCNPINDVLEARENLLWIGRPNAEIYTRGNRTRRGYMSIGIWTTVFFLVAVVGLILDMSSNGTFDGNWVFIFVVMLGALFVFNYVAFAPRDYKRAEWYAFSEKRVFLVAWDDEDCDFAIYQTELSNLRNVAVRKSNKAPKEAAGIGNLVCAYHPSIQRRACNQFTFELIDSPTEVQALLLDAKAASII